MVERLENGLYVVEPRKIENTDKFREAAIRFQENGFYTAAPKGTSAYIEYWREERLRCLDGYTAPDGDWISGYNYFYLNYCPILLINEKIKEDRKGKKRKVIVRERDFPDFWDSDYDYFMSIDAAEAEGKHLVVLKARGKGYSFKGGSMLCRNYFMIPESKSYAIASEMEFLLKDGLLSKAWEFMDFIDQHTGWSKKRQAVNKTIHKRASYIVTDDEGTKSESGYRSEIIGVSLKNDPDKARGKRGKLILWEEGGKFPDLIKSWQTAQPSVEDSGIAHGLMIAFGTGGTDDADYEGLQELFMYPDGYNALPFKNIWDDAGNVCGYFVPEYVNMYGKDSEGRPLQDEGGNTEYHIATRHALAKRDQVLKGANDRNAIDRYIAEHPFNPTEACLQLSGNIFPKEELIRHLAYIRNTEKLSNYKQVGDLEWDESGLLKWVQATRPKDIIKYRLKADDNKRGQIVIWEHPADNPPHGLYIAGCLTPGEKVLTNKGLVNVEDVRSGDKLINKEGELVDIINFQIREKVDHDIFKFKMSNTYRTTTFTRGHPLYISKTGHNSNKTINENKFNFKFTRANQIEKGDWTKWPNVYRSKNTFDIKDIWKKYKSTYKKLNNPLKKEDFWWFVGLWLGDGCCYNNTISISFNKSEVYYINKAKNIIEDILNRSPQIRNKGENTIEISFNSKQLCSFLTDNFGKYSYGKYVSEWVKRLDNQYKYQLLWGYLASDGCITTHTKGYYSTEFVSVSLELLESIQDILFSVGVVSGLSKLRDSKRAIIENREVLQKDTFHLRLSHHSTLDFIDGIEESFLENSFYSYSIYEDPKVKKLDFNNLPKLRKRPKDGCFISKDKKYIYFQIKNIEHSLYTGDVYNFECDTHNYISHHISQKNCDPYDHDQAATSDSLGSVFIYKRFQDFESFYDIIVAEYTGRPDTVNEFYENARKLLMYYNAKLLYENEKPGLFNYFSNKHSEYLLADQPDYISQIVGNSTVRRKKGIHMVTGIKDEGELKIRDWLNEEYEPGKKNLTKLMSEPLIEELVAYNRDGNFDRVIAFMLVMLYKEELHNLHVKKARDEEKNNNLFREPLFSNVKVPKFINL